MFLFRKRASKTCSLRARLGGFDEAYYLWKNPDVARQGVDPLRHYLEHGWREGRDPCASFSTEGYLTHNPDVRADGINPLIHFWETGLAEGRDGWQVKLD